MTVVSNPVSAPTDQLSEAIARLRSLTQTSIQGGWRYCDEDLPIAQATQPATWRNWSIADLNDRNHIAWSKGQQVRWLGQTIEVPPHLENYPLEGLCLKLALTWWAELAQIFVNGQLVQEGDLFDHSTRLLLSSAVIPGEEIAIALRLVSPGHDDGALVRSVCHYEVPAPRNRISSRSEAETTAPLEPKPDFLTVEPSFIADELDVLRLYLQTFAPQNLEILSEAVTAIDWSTLIPHPSSLIPHPSHPFTQTLAKLRDRLLPLSPFLKQRRIRLLGHAHLDMAWLWTVAETWNAAERTFESALNLQKDFPELIFCHSTPALYEWIEQNRPALFEQIRQAIAAEWWEPVGGLWIEPELNIIRGESIVRQVLYGQRYFQEKFGSINRMAWLPDSFGFTWQLPQILKQGGIDYFVTQKLRWNDTTKFPYEVFQWRSPDGTEIFSLMSAPIGEGIDPIKMATYACDWETKTGIPDVLWLPGVGDHGGGPTRDMLEIARRWQKSPFFPQLEFSTALDYLQDLEANYQPDAASSFPADVPNIVNAPQTITNETQSINAEPQNIVNEAQTFKREPQSINAEPQSISAEPQNLELKTQNSKLSTPHTPHPTPHSLPFWNSDLYLEFHRGCYTTHADQKRYNRSSEELLYQAELWASLATISAGFEYPKAELEAAWKKVLFNQFHDILPGSSITEVFDDANQAWGEVTKISQEIMQRSLDAIAQQIALPAPPHPDAKAIVVFNPLNWERSQLVWVKGRSQKTADGKSDPPQWQICDIDGQSVELQHSDPVEARSTGSWVSFVAEDIPAVGYRCYWLSPCEAKQSPIEATPELFVLENEFLKVTVSPETGDLLSVFDKTYQREVLSSPSNQIQAFQDSGQYWDAWNIDPNYANHPLLPAELTKITYRSWAPKGHLENGIAVRRTIGRSEFWQTYSLSKGSPALTIHTSVGWYEKHVIVKATFSLNLEADYATYEIPCGVIQRTTKPETETEKAQWEVPAMHWADLSDGNYGVSLLNDCKYGYDAKPNQLRLTLLRGSEFPDPDADKGQHSFTYALYPHAGDWKAAHTVKHGYELNMPLLAQVIPANEGEHTKTLPPTASLLDLGADNLVLMALKQSEDSPDEWVLRCYECHGEDAQLNFQSDLGLELGERVDLLERSVDSDHSQQATQIQPWTIASFKVTASAQSHIAHTSTALESPGSDRATVDK